MTKPNDFFVGVVDFFAILLPGALLTFIGRDLAVTYILGPVLPSITGEVESWVAFIFASYLIGHFVSLVSPWLDPIYDRTYATYQRLKKQHRSDMSFQAKMRLFWQILRGVKILPDEPLLVYSKAIKKKDLEDAELITGQKHTKMMNTVRWSTAVVRLQNPAAATDIDRVEADSKFFRSLTISLFAISIYIFFYSSWVLLLGCLLLSSLSCWRYMNLRWKRTALTLEYFVALRKIPKDKV